MTDDPMDRVPQYNRVSLRAVLVQEGDDVNAALAAAGIHDPIALPVVFGETVDLSGGILGNGVTPNLTAVLETEHEEPFDDAISQSAPSEPRVEAPARPGVTRLPAAFGTQPLAPVRQRGG